MITRVYDCSPSQHYYAERKHMKITQVIPVLAIGIIELTYTLPPKEALICAVQQYRHANWQTWDYPEVEDIQFVEKVHKMWVKGHPSIYVRR